MVAMLKIFSETPAARRSSPERTARVLRAHFARHNRRVFILAVATLLAAAAAWLLIYGICCWLLLLALAALDLPRPVIPRGFPILFIVVALCAIAYAWLDHRLTPNESPRDDKRPGEILADFLLALPRVTLAVGGTLAAWQRMSDAELAQAAAFLHRLAERKSLPMSSVRQEIPDATAAARILFALQITQVIDTRRDGAEFWLKLNPLRPAVLRLALRRPIYAHA